MKQKQNKQLTQVMMEKSKQKTHKTTGKVKKYFLGLLAVILTVVGITASFIHKAYLPAENNPNIIKLDNYRSELKDYWNEKERKHDSLYKNDHITKEQYFKIKDINEKQRKSDFNGVSTKRMSYSLEFSFNGRNSFHYWLWAFGVFLTMFIIVFYLIVKDARLYKKGLLKWYEPHATISFLTISLFWLYHTIFKKDYDFELDIYLVFLFVILLPISYFLYHFIRRIFVIEEKLLGNIRLLTSHVLKHTKDEKENEKWNILDKISENGR